MERVRGTWSDAKSWVGLGCLFKAINDKEYVRYQVVPL
jgi:hypothetical protein